MEKIIYNLVIAFLTEMNLWEKYCHDIDSDNTIPFEKKEELQKERIQKIYNIFCTPKERKYGLINNISYGHEGSFLFNPKEEKIIKIINENKSIVKVFTKREKPISEENYYTLKKIKEKWLIDSKFIFSSLDNKWENAYL